MAEQKDINEDLDLEEQAREEDRRREALMETLANSIESKFQQRAKRRTTKEAQWLRSARLYYGKLSIDNYQDKGETPFENRPYTDRPDVNIVRSKCSAAIAQTVSMQFGTSNKNWDIYPSKSDRSPESGEAAMLMSDEIESQLEDCKYAFASRKAMWDRVVLGTGVMKGPLSTGKLMRSYRRLEGTETWVPDLVVDYTPIITHVSPWFFYPDESVSDPTKIEDTIEVHPKSALELKKYMKHEGFDPISISEVLEDTPSDYITQNWADFAELTETNSDIFKNKYLVLEYHGPITRTQLDELGVECTYDSANDEYYGEVWVCQGKVIRLELASIEASFSCPYYVSPWEKDPSSVFGFGVPLMMEDAQRVVNEAWHMILDNTAISSGPQAAMHKDLIEPANGEWELRPRQIWYLNDMQVDVEKAIQFFDVPNVTANIVPILQMAQAFGEEESQIPMIAAGLTSPEVGDTATGQLAAYHASTTLLDFMSEEWDDHITEPIIEAMYAWNMQYNPKPEIKGQFSIDVRTSTEYKNKQMHIRDMEKLSVEAAQNPELAKHIDMNAMSRLRLEMMHLPSKGIIKPKEQVEQEDAERAANQGPDHEVMQLQLEARRLDLEEARLAFELNQNQQREFMENEERMAANQARLIEAEARVTVSQNEKEIEILKLAQKSEEAAARILSSENITKENNQTKVFLTSLQETRKLQEVEQHQRERDLANRIGKGI